MKMHPIIQLLIKSSLVLALGLNLPTFGADDSAVQSKGIKHKHDDDGRDKAHKGKDSREDSEPTSSSVKKDKKHKKSDDTEKEGSSGDKAHKGKDSSKDSEPTSSSVKKDKKHKKDDKDESKTEKEKDSSKEPEETDSSSEEPKKDPKKKEKRDDGTEALRASLRAKKAQREKDNEENKGTQKDAEPEVQLHMPDEVRVGGSDYDRRAPTKNSGVTSYYKHGENSDYHFTLGAPLGNTYPFHITEEGAGGEEGGGKKQKKIQHQYKIEINNGKGTLITGKGGGSRKWDDRAEDFAKDLLRANKLKLDH